jgi:hypothetical protein
MVAPMPQRIPLLPYLLPHVRAQIILPTILSTPWDAATWPIVRVRGAAGAGDASAGRAGGMVKLDFLAKIVVVGPWTRL